tara:strand:+ start:281 stop:868 length:588 start_codon:yes stop_codon:yes gene_type:complete
MNRKEDYNRGISLVEKLIKSTDNILKRSLTHKKLQGNTPIEPLKNYCLKNIEALNKLNRKALNIPDIVYEHAKKRMFDIYFTLQDYRGAERQLQRTAEVPLDSILNMLDEHAIESYAAEMRTGGLGFASVSGATFYISEATDYNEYWKPPKKRSSILDKPDYGVVEYKPKQTIEAWREDMALQKKEVMNEVYRLQ